MLSRSIMLSLVAAAGVAAAAPASAADLNGYSYKPYKSGSPYDDPRYADLYGDEEPRYDTRRYRGSYKDDPVPYVELETLGPQRRLTVGESLSATNRYSLFPRGSGDPEAAARRVLGSREAKPQ